MDNDIESRRNRSSPLRSNILFKFLAPLVVALLCLALSAHVLPGRPIELSKGLSKRAVAQLVDEDTLLYRDSNASLFKRDQYACQKGVPCKTDACCGSFNGGNTGECGFGPQFCGSDCDSQCNAKPPCGQYANPPGQQCPLNVCCSQYGFCGSTSDFCNAQCQSNCVLNPPVPAGGSSQSVLTKVIAYYESWAAQRSCRTFAPSALPATGLTNVNYAFAYIDPGTLAITPMDGSTPTSSFSQTTNVKNSGTDQSALQVFVSVGGWSFSDNGTDTQPLFPAIAADPGKRQTFANNLVSFMTQYGFDGVDIDWEYPGAPDRGGNGLQDTTNYPLLLQTMRSTFQASPKGNFGISFTIPSSYWYLRWFNVPALLKYADWANLMSYDLHGVWDEYDDIGAIVQAHTNLTEIKQSLELLWRNNVPPGKVVLGLGFYGRSFELANAACATPGCPFSGPAAPGPCTDNAGTLAYFEIMDIISVQKPNVIFDQVAAVKYFQFGPDGNQWVSYDDAETFKLKVDYANSVGLGGVMIWSIDQDDNNFSALSGVLGEQVPAEDSLSPLPVPPPKAPNVDSNHWAGLNGQKCYVTDCLLYFAPAGPKLPLNFPPAGYSIAPNGGPFPDTCNGFFTGKFILCPTDEMPQSCQWRGSGSCHGQCLPGEVTLAHSPWGSQYCLVPGQQAFCCVSNEWSPFVKNCNWAPGCGACPSDAPYQVSQQQYPNGWFSTCTRPYCCPYPFQNCHWVGQGTCDDNECSGTDVEVGLDPWGDTGSQCAAGLNGRLKALCCNTPKNLNPFLPVPLGNLFPTLPPSTDLPAFDKQTLTSSQAPTQNPVTQAFFFVVIDGPPSTVTNVNKRDGSHIEFISRGIHHGQEPQVAYFVCTDDSEASNCDEMHLDGIEGTIIRFPDDQGFAQWGVAHSVTETDKTIPGHLSKRTPRGAKVHALEYSYNFSLAKKDSGPIYIRVDYSDSGDYYTQVVAAPHQKRGNGSDDSASGRKDRRFWSANTSIWTTLMNNLRSEPYRTDGTQPVLEMPNFNVLLFGDDGSTKNCSEGGADGFLQLNLAGYMSSTLKFGTTLVGTISPSLSLQEAYSYVNHDMHMAAELKFNGKGTTNFGSSAQSAPLFSSPITGYEAVHPGIVAFAPQMSADILLQGSAQVDGNFQVAFQTGTSTPIRLNAPPQTGAFTGQANADRLLNPFTGSLGASVVTPGNTIMSLGVNFESTIAIDVFNYNSAVQAGAAQLTGRTSHAVEIQTASGNEIVVLDGGFPATAEVFQYPTIQSGWSDGTTHAVGSSPGSAQIFSGNQAPSPRAAPTINGYAIFGDKDFIKCSNGNDNTETLICTWDILAIDPSLANNTAYKRKRDLLQCPKSSGNHTLFHERRGPNTGQARIYYVYDAAGPGPGGKVNAFPYTSPSFPNGDDGDSLDNLTERNERYGIETPGTCTATAVTDDFQGGTVESDHISDVSVYPNYFLQFVQTGMLDTFDGQGYIPRTTLPLFTYSPLANNFAQPYQFWVPRGQYQAPNSAAYDTAHAMGSSDNPQVIINLEAGLNGLKGRTYTTDSRPMSDANWNPLLNPTAGNAEAALSHLRAVFSVFNYQNDNTAPAQPHYQLSRVFEGVQVAHGTFDSAYAGAFPNRPERLSPLWTEFVDLWLKRVQNYNQQYVTERLNQLSNVWGPLQNSPVAAVATQAQSVMQDIATLRSLIPTQLVFNPGLVP